MRATVARTILATDLGLIALLAASSSFSTSLPQVSRQGLYAQSIFTLVTMGFIPLFWAWQARPQNLTARAYYNLNQPLHHTTAGAFWAAASLAAIAALTTLLQFLDLQGPHSALDAMRDVMTWPLALTMACCAAFGEEILFRGLLQRHLGLLNQAGLFALLHASYGSLLQVLGTLVLGLSWGFAARRNLWPAIIAHASYDLVALAP